MTTEPVIRHVRVIGKARGRRIEPGIPRDWVEVLDRRHDEYGDQHER